MSFWSQQKLRGFEGHCLGYPNLLNYSEGWEGQALSSAAFFLTKSSSCEMEISTIDVHTLLHSVSQHQL